MYPLVPNKGGVRLRTDGLLHQAYGITKVESRSGELMQRRTEDLDDLAGYSGKYDHTIPVIVTWFMVDS